MSDLDPTRPADRADTGAAAPGGPTTDGPTTDGPTTDDPDPAMGDDLAARSLDPAADGLGITGWTADGPGAGGLADGAGMADRPRRRAHLRLRRRWILVALVVLAVAAGLLGRLVWGTLHGGTTLSLPDRVAGLRHDTDSDAAQTASYLRDALAAGLSLDHTTGAVYTDPTDRSRAVFFFGGTGKFHSPGDELDRMLSLLNDATGTVTGLHEVPAGRLGGVQKCGTAGDEDGGMSVCGWADGGSVAVALFASRSVDEAAGMIGTLRAAIEHR